MRYSEHLSNLDELILRCRTEQAKEYISESILCYKVGAFRACIVNTWIAVVFDLIEKIRELHNSGNVKATELYEKFELYQKQLQEGNKQGLKPALEFERNILENVNEKLDFFTIQELNDLKQLHYDRNKCGHPSYQSMELPYKPSAEQARLHLRNAVVHVLESQPVQGKAVLEELEQLVLSNYFPKDRKRIKEQLETSSFANPSDVLVRAFIDTLMFGLKDDKSAYYLKINVVLPTLNTIIDIHYDKAIERITNNFEKKFKNISDEEYTFYILFILHTRDIFDNLTPHTKNKIEEFFRKEELYKEDKTDFVIIITLGSKIDSLGPIIRNSVIEYIDKPYHLGKLVSRGYHDYKLIEKSIELYSKSNNWDDANSIATNLIIPLSKFLTEENIETIIKSPKEKGADLKGSFEFPNFLEEVVNQNILTQKRLNELLIENDCKTFCVYEVEE